MLWISAARPGRVSGDHRLPARQARPETAGAGLGAIADLGFVGLDADPAAITGYKAARDRPLTRGQKLSNTALAAVRAPVEHGFARTQELTRPR
ncbi:hypothetical protein [Streptomyces acidicola]|uniref:hypothetical protein n=1 Tax=Streptomyces acidicola TaxID=2596892 RepID=UPI0018845D0E